MNKIVLLFVSLFLVFCAFWVFKSKTPLNRNVNEVEQISNWWDTEAEIEPLSNEVSEEWYLDPRIPADYVPVLGQNGLYMQVDEKGTIIAYWQCTEDGNALNWEKVNPDVPDNYEPIDGVNDVYKVTNANGSVTYYKYIRNPDNSFTFVEVDSHGNIIDEYITSCESQAATDNTIPTNYMQIDDDIYAVKNKEGVVVGYKEKSEDSNGKLQWTPVSEDQVDFNNRPTNNNRNNNNGSRNNGVVTNKVDVPEVTTASGSPFTVTTGPKVTTPPEETTTIKVTDSPATTTKQTKTHTQKETYQEVKYEGEYKCTYEYSIIKTFDDYGNLISSETDGPYLIDKSYAGNSTPDVNPALIEANIDNEILRVATPLQNSGAAADSVINSLNAERNSNGLPSLATNGDAQKLATLFAADMATYDNTTNTSPMYGTIVDLMNRYGISNRGYGLNIWRTASDDATAIHQRFQSIDNCRKARMNSTFNQIGVAIFYNNGYYYVAEVLLLQ